MRKKLSSFKNTEKGVDRLTGMCYYNDVGREKIRISERVFATRKIKIWEESSMAGYNGYSMSNNAVSAYADGEKPLSKWTKSNILKAVEEAETNGLAIGCSLEALKKLPVKALKENCLYNSSWHHTSNYYNKTEFYELDTDKLEDLTDARIAEILAEIAAEKKPEQSEEVWECSFLEWSGSRNYPKATRYTEIGTVRGDWFYRQNGSKKKTTSNGFEFIHRIK